jgi:hypothetical protein
MVAAFLVRAFLPLLLAGSSGKLKISLDVKPHAAHPGQRVEATADLSGLPDGPDFACPEVQWTWGDGSEGTVDAGDCTEDAGTPRKQFVASHAYAEAGHYSLEVAVTPKSGSPIKATASLKVAADHITIETLRVNKF